MKSKKTHKNPKDLQSLYQRVLANDIACFCESKSLAFCRSYIPGEENVWNPGAPSLTRLRQQHANTHPQVLVVTNRSGIILRTPAKVTSNYAVEAVSNEFWKDAFGKFVQDQIKETGLRFFDHSEQT
jgi:hypothetical protein